MMRDLCKHCQQRKIYTRDGLLCWVCTRTPAIRHLYRPPLARCQTCGYALNSLKMVAKHGPLCRKCRKRSCMAPDLRERLDEADRLEATLADGGPVVAPQGSPLKMAVLGKRAALGLSLWHPQDRRE